MEGNSLTDNVADIHVHNYHTFMSLFYSQCGCTFITESISHLDYTDMVKKKKKIFHTVELFKKQMNIQILLTFKLFNI